MNHHPHWWAPRGAVVCSRPIRRIRSEFALTLLGFALLGAITATRAQTPTVESVTVTKGSSWRQMTAGDPILEPRNAGVGYGGPFNFLVDVNGTDLAAITPPVITLAPGSLYPSQNPARHNGGVLAYSAPAESWRYGVDANQWGGQTAAERDASFAAGTYGFNVLGESFSLNFPATAFPSTAPKFILTGGTWSGGKYVVDPTQEVTITTSPFANFPQNADGVMMLWVDNTPFGAEVFRSDSPAAPNFLSVTIPANSLTPGTDYRAGGNNYAVTDKRGTSSTRYDAAAYESFSTFTIAAMPPSSPTAQGKFHGVGELDGGSDFSEVRDATKTGGVIYAVGDGISNTGSGQADTAFVWSSTDGLRPLPDITTNFSSASSIAAPAITPDGAFIASRARAGAGGTQRHAVRVTRSTLTNLDLGTLPGFNFSQTSTISSDGSVLYGIAQYTSAAAVPVKNRAVRFAGGAVTTIPFVNASDDNSTPADRGASTDGNVVVGRSTNGTTDAADGVTGIGAGNRAFRYVHSTATLTPIPLAPGGTWNGAVAVSPDGNLTLSRGDSTFAPQGEFVLHNAATSALTQLGTPNGSRRPGGIVGMSSDGVVIATPFIPADNTTSSTYIRNAHGWHDFESIVTAAGINFTGWRLNENLFGMSPDATLVWGRGLHNGVREGFVIEFAPGFLASYEEPATFGTPDAAIVGAWLVGDPFTTEAAVLVFGSDGYYTHIQRKNDADSADGFERGRYTWNSATGAFTVTTLLDTGGDHGLSASNGVAGLTVTITGDTATMTHPGEDPVFATRVTANTPIVGGFGYNHGANDFAQIVLLPSGHYFLATDSDPAEDDSPDGVEIGTYSWDSVTGIITFNVEIDTNGDAGFSHPGPGNTLRFTFSGDLMTLRGVEDTDFFEVQRIGASGVTGSMPVINTPPTNQSVTVGNPAMLTVAASGASLTYQWYRAGLPLPGATGATYYIPSATRADADTYFVRVKSGYRYVDSAPVRLTVAPTAFAQALQLDPALAPAIDASGSQAFTNKIALAPGGKFVVAGFFHTVAGQPRSRVARFNGDGSLDATFAPAAGGPLAVLSVAVQADGKILVGGNDTVVLGHPRRLVRFNSDGTVDTAFNTGSGFAGGTVNAIAVEADGHILVGGAFTSFNGTPCNRLVRLNSNGSLDALFACNPDNVVNALALQANGLILAGGSFTTINGSPRSRIARIDIDGQLDPSFVPAGGANGTVFAVDVATDGSNAIVIGGAFTSYNGTTCNRIARLTSTGALDATLVTGTGFNNNVMALACQPDGRILAGGLFTTYNGPTSNRLVRLNVTGSVDATFAVGTAANATVNTLALLSDGRVLAGGNFSAFNGAARNSTFARLSSTGAVDAAVNPALFCSATPATLVRQPNGQFLVGGNFTRVGGGTRFNLARFHADGSLDAAFNPGVTSATSIGGPVLAAYPRVDGKTVILGSFTAVGGVSANRIARLNPDGSLDPAFHSGGGFTAAHGFIVAQPDGKLLIGGNGSSNVNYDGNARSGLVRLLPDGQFDYTFNESTLFNGAVEAAVVQPDGRIVVAGNFTTVNGIAHSNIARLLADGSLDPSFTTLPFNNSVTALALQPDGRIVAGGAFTLYAAAPRNRLIRFLSDGTADSSFDVGTGPNLTVNGVLLQEDGKLLVRGPFTAWNGSAAGSTVVRLRPDGTLDPTFGLFGPVTPGTSVPGLLVNDDGSMLAIGGAFYDLVNSRPGLARLANSTALKINTPPGSLVVNEGQPANFSVAASGLPTLTYQWRKNGTNIGGATSASYAIPSAQPTDAGSYDVLVTNATGTLASNPATLTVQVPPQIVTSPTAQEVNLGQPASFTGSASGDPAPAYQWFKDGVAIPGATAASYAIGATTKADAGFYWLRATNAAGVAFSTSATLHVLETYAEWSTSAGLVGPAALDSADPDGDGVTNLMEYALGTSPTGTSSTAAIIHPPVAATVEFTFLRPMTVTGITYTIETATSLAGPWTPHVFTVDPAPGGGEEMNLTLPTSTPAAFVRLKVERAP